MPVSKPAPVAVALDAPDLETAARWAALVTPHVSTVKVGLELYLRYGPDVVATVRGASRVSVFLDLKLHDIPVTVAGAARAVARLRPEVLTVHAAGGADVVRAAVEAAPGTMVAAVTVLTSLGDDDLGRIGLSGPVPDAVLRLAALSVEAGAQGLVCSPREVSAVRAEVGDDVTLITPGVRPAGSEADDQARVATPEEALLAGADLLVIGRPITRASDPGAAAYDWLATPHHVLELLQQLAALIARHRVFLLSRDFPECRDKRGHERRIVDRMRQADHLA